MDDLRKQVKLLKALQDISYKEIAEYAEIPLKSFYNWLSGQFNFSQERIERLKDVVSTLQE